ncbi:MAG: metallophosphoesterase [Sedimentisphaerales bacterium]|nr:metallophosphoesterase [Sedimentisphaerales bacterium]
MANQYRRYTRRQIIRTAAGAAVFVVLPRWSWAGDSSPGSSVRWAFLSDTHIPENNPAEAPKNHYFFAPAANLTTIVSQILEYAPDAAAIAGDLARLEGKAGDYRRFKKLIAPLEGRIPLCLGLGNHDDRGMMLDFFGRQMEYAQDVPGKLVTVMETGPVRIIMLDSLLTTNYTPGWMGRAQRDWLTAYLASCDERPTLLCLHHPPGGQLLDSERFMEIVRPCRKVKAIIYGHSHVYGVEQDGDLHRINLPATAYSFKETVPVGWMQARLDAQGGVFTLRVIGGSHEADGQAIKLSWRK